MGGEFTVGGCVWMMVLVMEAASAIRLTGLVQSKSGKGKGLSPSSLSACLMKWWYCCVVYAVCVGCS